MVNKVIKIIFGTGGFDPASGRTFDQAVEMLNVLKEQGIQNIDTGYIYGKSEEWLGEAGAASRFIVDTKHPGGLSHQQATAEDVLQKAEESLKRLQTDSVDTYFIHAPDHRVPVKETLAAIDKLYKAGKFKRFGLSQYNAAEVEEVIRVAKENSYVLPTVFQSNYNAVARRQERDVLPLLRKHGIAFYAYSPIAGGFLAKTPETIVQGGKGRWDPKSFVGKLYHSLYYKPSMLNALGEFGTIAKDAGISQVALAYRWLAFNSALRGELGDGLIIGPQNVMQLSEVLEILRQGPLSEEIGARVDALWPDVEEDSPLDNWEAYTSQLFK